MEYPTVWTCDNNATTTCQVIATSTNTLPTYQDWLMVNGIQVFLLAILIVNSVFGLMKKK